MSPSPIVLTSFQSNQPPVPQVKKVVNSKKPQSKAAPNKKIQKVVFEQSSDESDSVQRASGSVLFWDGPARILYNFIISSQVVGEIIGKSQVPQNLSPLPVNNSSILEKFSEEESSLKAEEEKNTGTKVPWVYCGAYSVGVHREGGWHTCDTKMPPVGRVARARISETIQSSSQCATLCFERVPTRQKERYDALRVLGGPVDREQRRVQPREEGPSTTPRNTSGISRDTSSEMLAEGWLKTSHWRRESGRKAWRRGSALPSQPGLSLLCHRQRREGDAETLGGKLYAPTSRRVQVRVHQPVATVSCETSLYTNLPQSTGSCPPAGANSVAQNPGNLKIKSRQSFKQIEKCFSPGIDTAEWRGPEHGLNSNSQGAEPEGLQTIEMWRRFVVPTQAYSRDD
ncbi:hypothetical protein B0H16DRAFT_1698824 [Mycena metata]|uniref:Uncharacterized protein n=1 Tax=Mycena metata TaxID=1033252 RepID=A0AAD7MM56_9AGAR|nr:hypothetical protein B0H16DRAFT_1698824 [Mycena metata]